MRLSGVCGIFLTLSAALAGTLPARADTAVDPVASIVAKVKPSVVTITCVKMRGKETGSDSMEAAATTGKPAVSTGSGFVIDPSGYIATNKHVIDGALSLFVTDTDGVRYPARIVGLTVAADIALIKIDTDKPFQSVKFGDSDKMRPGDTVIAIGSPFGFEQTITSGIVSAVNRDIRESPFDDYIQTDAPINHGNSGGPLFNLAGEVIGMNSILFAPGTYSGSVGLGFAIPSDDLNFVYHRLMATGRLNAGMLPIRTQQVTWMLAQAIGAPGLNGALVDSMAPGGKEAMNWQVEPGDLIVSFNGQKVWDPRDLARKAAQAQVGSEAELGIFRDHATIVARVPIAAWPEGKPSAIDDRAPHNLGLTLAADPDGSVRVDSVDPNGSAASSGIEKDDVLVRVQGQQVSNPEEALHKLQTLSEAKRSYAAVLVDRKGQRTWMALAVPE